jgi:hypothetical protein
VRNWFWNTGEQAFVDYSYSFVNADYLMRHAYSYIGWRFQPRSSFTMLDKGDFFVIDLVAPYKSGPATHGRFVVGWGPYPGYSSTLLINQHTANRYHVPYSYEIPGINTDYNIWKIETLGI